MCGLFLKLMSLVEDLMIEIETLRSKNEELQHNFKKMCTEEVGANQIQVLDGFLLI